MNSETSDKTRRKIFPLDTLGLFLMRNIWNFEYYL